MNQRQAIKLNRKFGYVIGFALLFIVAFQYVFKHKQDFAILIIAAFLLLVSLVIPKWLTLFRIVWDKIGHVLSIINTYVLLSVFYILILTPLGLLMKLFGKDILKLKISQSQTSYWEVAPKTDDGKMENQF